ncbi:DUF2341 domain-containing protein [Planctomycetota bacterium]
MLRLFPALLLVWLLFWLNQPCSYAAWYGAWKYRKKITILAAKVENSNQNAFPVLINATEVVWKDVANLGHVAQNDGGDFLFTGSDGSSKLAHEIEEYNPATGKLVAWVNIPVLSSSADTVIYLYYGNAACADQWAADGSTWNADYVAVQHLNEIIADGVTGHMDSTANGHHGTPYNFQAGAGSTDSAGKIDGADLFDGNNDYVLIPDHDQLSPHTGAGGEMTVAAWIYMDDLPAVGGQNRRPPVAKGNGGGTWEYALYVFTDGKVGFSVWQLSGSGHNEISGGSITADAWHYLVGAYKKGDYCAIYMDGALVTSSGSFTGDTGNGASPVYIGRRGDGQFINAIIDAVRISKVARSADWIKTSFNNQNDPSTFYAIDPIEQKARGSSVKGG